MAEKDEYEEIDVYPLRSFRFAEMPNEPTVRLLRLSSGAGEAGIVHTYALNSQHLRKLAAECIAEAEKLERIN